MKSKKRMNRLERKMNRTGWLFVAIPVICLIVFTFYPFLRAVANSVRTSSGNLSLINFERILQDSSLHKTFKMNLYLILISVGVMLPFALINASIMEQKGLRFKGIYRTFLFIPCAMAFSSCATVFQILFRTDGIVNRLLVWLGILNEPYGFFTQKFGAYLMIFIVQIWRWTGYNMVIYCAYMSQIDTTVYEAAAIDGCNGIKRFFYITVPLLKPAILLTTITSINSCMQALDEVFMLTGGGPGDATETINMYIYNMAFGNIKHNYASAMGLCLMVVIVLLTLLQMKVGEKNNG